AFAERIADGEADIASDEWVVLHQDLSDRSGGGLALGRSGYFASLLQLTVGEDIYDEAHWTIEIMKDSRVDNAITTGLIREVFGNPFRPIDFSPEWRTDTALSLARQMYESRDFGVMPILADALQDAGCDNELVLSHCRDANAEHFRGCWVVDGVLRL